MLIPTNSEKVKTQQSFIGSSIKINVLAYEMIKGRDFYLK